MSIIGQNILAGASGGGAYTIDQSLRFNSADSPVLSRTPAGAGDRTAWTWSGWVKRAELNGVNNQIIFGSENGSDREGFFSFQSGETIKFGETGADSSSYILNLLTTQVCRDVGAWYHLVFVWDSDNGVQADRARIYENGSRVTDFATNTNTVGSGDSSFINGTDQHMMGKYVNYSDAATYKAGQYLAEVYFIDGQALTPSSFAETNELTNQWVPKEVVGMTFGTNGFYQKYDSTASNTTFTDSSSSALTITAVGNTTNTVAQKKVGTSSIYFDGSGDYLTAPSTSMGLTGDFTMEFWFYTATSTSDNGIMSNNFYQAGTDGNFTIRLNDSAVGNNIAYRAYDGTTVTGGGCRTPGSVWSDNTWTHYALVREGTAINNVTQYIDGVAQTNQDVSGAASTSEIMGNASTFNIGAQVGTSANQINAYMDEIRISDTARYTGTFTPSTTEFVSDSNTVFLLHSNFRGGLGSDSSGNDNDFAVTNLVATDQLLDSPTNNFATLTGKLLVAWGTRTYAEGNLKITSTSGDWNAYGASVSVNSGKWYWETRIGTGATHYIGIVSTNNDNFFGAQAANPQEQNMIVYYGSSGQKKIDGTFTAYGDTFTDGDIIGAALDLDSGTQTITFYKNNVSQGAITLTGGTAAAGVRIIPCGVLLNTMIGILNYGQDSSFAGEETAQANADGNGIGEFYYAVPAGYLALCSSNLSDPSIALPGEYFNTLLWTGDGSAEAVTGAGFAPDLIWCSGRSNTNNKKVYDQLRGISYALRSNTTGVQSYSTTENLSSFDSGGFTIKDPDYINNGYTFVAWNWSAGGGAGSSNTDGATDTTSTSANVTAGFSISTLPTYSGPTTFGHGLSVAPDLVIMKGLTNADQWTVGSTPVGWTKGLPLNTGASEQTNSGFWNDTAPTASVVNLGTWGEGFTRVMYCFHSIEGYSRVSAYIGNVAADGTYVYTGFRPACIIIKGATYSSDWHIFDSKRIGYNVANYDLTPSENTVEDTAVKIDFLSNGFKIRTNAANINSGGNTLLYYAVAEFPFKTTNAR